MERRMVDEQQGEHDADTDEQAQPAGPRPDDGEQGADEGDPAED